MSPARTTVIAAAALAAAACAAADPDAKPLPMSGVDRSVRGPGLFSDSEEGLVIYDSDKPRDTAQPAPLPEGVSEDERAEYERFKAEKEAESFREWQKERQED